MFEIATLATIAPHLFLIVGGLFSAGFMILVFAIFVKALLTHNLGDIFKETNSNRLSMTKFWTNVAYCAATIAFLALNIVQGDKVGSSLEIIWLIYLGVVASNALASKWLTLRFNQPNDGGNFPIKKVVNKTVVKVAEATAAVKPDSPD